MYTSYRKSRNVSVRKHIWGNYKAYNSKGFAVIFINMMQRWSRNQSFTLQDNFANQTGTLMAIYKPKSEKNPWTM